MLYVGIFISIFFFIMGSPIYAAFGLGSSFLILLLYGLPVQTIASYFIGGINSFIFLAIPLFIIMGDLFDKCGVSTPLIGAFKKMLSSLKLKSSLGIVGIVSNGFFAAISGSSVASIVAIGNIMAPELKKDNYEEGVIGALIASSGGIGIIIPPSISLICFGVLTDQNIAMLYAGGFLPGILAVTMLCMALIFISRKDDKIGINTNVASNNLEKKDEERFSILNSIPALMAPVIVLGGIYGGIFTPSEAAAVGVVYTIFLGIFVYRKLTLKNLIESFKASMTRISSISLILCGGILLGKMTILSGLPQKLTSFVLKYNINATVFLLIATFILVLMGFFIPEAVIILVFVPLTFQTVVSLGISPVQYAIFMVFSLTIGACTPPVATNIFAASMACKVPVEKIYRKIYPFVIAYITVLILIIYFPEISLLVPKLMGFF